MEPSLPNEASPFRKNFPKQWQLVHGLSPRIDAAVNSVKNDTEECIEPVED